MFTVSCNLDYANAYKSGLINYLRSSLRSEIKNQDLNDFFDQIEMVDKLLNQINKDFTKINEKYKLLFGLREFESLLKEKDFKKEIMLYIKYKDSEQQ